MNYELFIYLSYKIYIATNIQMIKIMENAYVIYILMIFGSLFSMSIQLDYEKYDLSADNMDKAIRRFTTCLSDKGFIHFVENKTTGFGMDQQFRSNLTVIRVKLVLNFEEKDKLINEINDYICNQLHPITELLVYDNLDGCKNVINKCGEIFCEYLFKPKKPQSNFEKRLISYKNAILKFSKNTSFKRLLGNSDKKKEQT
ncbi:uncharacterized protein LOC126905617 [Daktulosphaira vitifoliae]|uniref:uncharacterized protein LOC126905617 n=1 Tax=Daktulosphaira vitifoliae TaxID=58002 RepID=UPI0021AA4A6F|nr:uncharacterized protein LOC126905617 [Daktulosphaira vitifoliae]